MLGSTLADNSCGTIPVQVIELILLTDNMIVPVIFLPNLKFSCQT